MSHGTRRARIALSIFILIALTTGAGCAADDGDPSTGSTEDGITGGDATDVDVTLDPYYRSVGKLYINYPGASKACSGTLIMRNIVLTAGHCFCGAPSPFITNGTDTQVSFMLPSQGGFGPPPTYFARTGASSVFWHRTSGICSDPIPSDAWGADLAIVILGSNVTVADAPAVTPVYTSGDLMDRVFASPPPPAPFFGDTKIVGFAGTTTRRAGTIFDWHFDELCGLFGWGDCSGWAEWSYVGSGTDTEKGDSGGPAAFQRDSVPGGTYWQFGVTSGSYTITAKKNYWTPTWDNGLGNGAFVREFIDDADGDGVNDIVDNCNPKSRPLCKGDVSRCKNADQADGDGDGVGDVCDNCATFSNATQANGDGDHYGDGCDLCPDVASTTNVDGDDGDGVGTACDNCPGYNPYRTCTTPSDCSITNTDGTVTTVACMPNNRCAIQLDDADKDGLGDICDTCPAVASADLQADSNDNAEQRDYWTGLGDACEEVPQYTVRPVAATPMSVPGTYTYPYTQVVQISAAAGIGSHTATPLAPRTHSVGFRQCDCHDTATSTNLDRDACLASRCTLDPTAYATSPSWHAITVGTNPAAPPSGPQPAADHTFTSTRTTVSEVYGPYVKSDEATRLGTRETIYWFHAQDVAAGRVSAYVDGTTTKTAGVFWSHTLPTGGSGLVTGDPLARDAASGGRLRDVYEYVTTPLYSLVGSSLSSPAPDGFDDGFTFRSDWWKHIGDPPAGDPVTDPIKVLGGGGGGPARVVVTGGADIAFRGAADPGVDVTTSLSADMRGLLGDSSRTWITAAESGARDVPDPVMAMSVPVIWTQGAMPVQIKRSSTGFEVADEQTRGQLAVTELPLGTRSIPTDRTGAKAVLSASTKQMFLIGGRSGQQPNGAETGEIWSYDLTSHLWSHLFNGAAYGGTIDTNYAGVVFDPSPRYTPRDVVAATFDARANKLLVIDDLVEDDAVVTNGSFEYQLWGWTTTGNYSVVTGDNGVDEYLGPHAALVGSTSPSTDSTMAQTFTVPATGADTLSFGYKVVCLDSVYYAWAYVTLYDYTTQQTTTIVPNTCSNTGAWNQVSYSLAAMRGHTVTLTFRNHDDNWPGDPIYMKVDAVTVPVTERRLALVDLATGAGIPASIALRTELSTKLGVVAADDGSYTVVKQTGATWSACRFTLAVNQGVAQPTFTTQWTGSGSLTSEPINTTQGVIVMSVDANQHQNRTNLSSVAGSPDVAGCSAL